MVNVMVNMLNQFEAVCMSEAIRSYPMELPVLHTDEAEIWVVVEAVEGLVLQNYESMAKPALLEEKVDNQIRGSADQEWIRVEDG
jgi:hypothetical protein